MSRMQQIMHPRTTCCTNFNIGQNGEEDIIVEKRIDGGEG